MSIVALDNVSTHPLITAPPARSGAPAAYHPTPGMPARQGCLAADALARLGGASGGAGRKVRLKFLLCCRCCQAFLYIFSSVHSLGGVSYCPQRSGSFLRRLDLASPMPFHPSGCSHGP